MFPLAKKRGTEAVLVPVVIAAALGIFFLLDEGVAEI
jgi:hypothetical protein